MTHSIGIRARFGVCLAAGMVALALRGGPQRFQIKISSSCEAAG